MHHSMKLSIITICYNNIQGLKQTFNSIASQSARSQFEYIVVDGASKDGTADFLKENDAKINKWVSEPDKGIYNAMNKGVTFASGEYILFLNSGDCLHDSDAIANILYKLESTDFVIGKVLFLNAGTTSDVSEPITMNRFYQGSVPHPATFTKKELLEKHPFDETLKIVSDWKFFIITLILENCSYKLIEDIITDFDCDGISSTNKSLVDRERERVLNELLPPRVMLDYLQFKNGSGYNDTPYDKFFIKLRDFQYAKVLYSLDVLIMKTVSLFKKGARFARNFPTKL